MPHHLIHVGYPKAASTFLQAWFESHPQLAYAPGGLGGFHNVYELTDPPEPTNTYYVTSCEAIAAPPATKGRPIFERRRSGDLPVRPIKRAQADVCTVLSRLFPGSRILIITRGFKAMIMSSYSQYVRAGGQRHLRGMCEELGSLLEREEHHYFDFDYFVGLYGEAFGEENLVVLPFELLRDDKATFISTLEERLGLTHHEVEIDVLNPSLSPAELYWYPVISRMMSTVISGVGRGRGYGRYTRKTMKNELAPLIRVLHRLAPQRTITERDLLPEILEHCRGRAERLEKYPEFAPYTADYLSDRGSR